MYHLEEGVVSEISKDKVKFVTGISLVPRKDDPDNDREVLDFSELNRCMKEQECKLPSVDDLHISEVMSKYWTYNGNIMVINVTKKSKPNFHNSGHVFSFARRWGPPILYWSRPFTKHPLKNSKVEYLVYIDYLLVHNFPKELQVLVTSAIHTLENVGLPINVKSLLVPDTTVEYIRWNLDFVKKEISLPLRKQQGLKN